MYLCELRFTFQIYLYDRSLLCYNNLDTLYFILNVCRKNDKFNQIVCRAYFFHHVFCFVVEEKWTFLKNQDKVIGYDTQHKHVFSMIMLFC